MVKTSMRASKSAKKKKKKKKKKEKKKEKKKPTLVTIEVLNALHPLLVFFLL
ncbi:hypothetical protein HanXRQr2_Chr05g0215651 [Helianthus annuus]|uniref:Uncharacterized protein n=1 Tax=Helianthus annuus TaxID=4232 RepID=A0A9K3J019_HELAN|nr:hypothetical protein HanXRQr2_Chr05g0215651 [Helianthus annuus]